MYNFKKIIFRFVLVVSVPIDFIYPKTVATGSNTLRTGLFLLLASGFPKVLKEKTLIAADRLTEPQTYTATDNKGCLKLKRAYQ